jgi:hypothetical protein
MEQLSTSNDPWDSVRRVASVAASSTASATTFVSPSLNSVAADLRMARELKRASPRSDGTHLESLLRSSMSGFSHAPSGTGGSGLGSGVERRRGEVLAASLDEASAQWQTALPRAGFGIPAEQLAAMVNKLPSTSPMGSLLRVGEALTRDEPQLAALGGGGGGGSSALSPSGASTGGGSGKAGGGGGTVAPSAEPKGTSPVATSLAGRGGYAAALASASALGWLPVGLGPNQPHMSLDAIGGMHQTPQTPTVSASTSSTAATSAATTAAAASQHQLEVAQRQAVLQQHMDREQQQQQQQQQQQELHHSAASFSPGTRKTDAGLTSSSLFLQAADIGGQGPRRTAFSAAIALASGGATAATAAATATATTSTTTTTSVGMLAASALGESFRTTSPVYQVVLAPSSPAPAGGEGGARTAFAEAMAAPQRLAVAAAAAKAQAEADSKALSLAQLQAQLAEQAQAQSETATRAQLNRLALQHQQHQHQHQHQQAARTLGGTFPSSLDTASGYPSASGGHHYREHGSFTAAASSSGAVRAEAAAAAALAAACAAVALSEAGGALGESSNQSEALGRALASARLTAQKSLGVVQSLIV